MIITDASIRNRTTVFVLIVIIIIVGAYSYVSLPRESAPDVPIPIILINTSYEGVSPQDIESQITDKIEKELKGIRGLKELRSSSLEGQSSIQVEFDPTVRTDEALQRVRDKVDLAKGDLPSEANDPVIQEINVAEMPIMGISISGDIEPTRLKDLADDLQDAIELIPGVLSADVYGVLEREIRLEVDQARLTAYNLTYADLLTTIPEENLNVSAGGLETQGTKFNVRVPAEFVQPSEIDGIILAVHDGKPIYLTDVAVLRDTFKDRSSYSRLDGKESVTLNVRKRIGANIVEIADAVKRILADAEKKAPAGVKYTLTFDRSKDIHMMIADLENNILTALVLVVITLVIFMGFGTSLIVAATIPISMLMTFTIIQALGYTLNMVVLFSLVMALGMLVDNAIVIVENIYRHLQLGYNRMEASILGAREVAWPVITSTLTTLAAFFPLMFWPGIMGGFMKYLPIVLIISLSCSLFAAMVINPTICSFIAHAPKNTAHRPPLVVRLYRRLLEIVLANGVNRFTALFLCGVLLLIMVIIYALAGHGVEFFPNIDPERATVSIRCPQGTNIHETNRLARIVEERVEPYHKETDFIVTNVGTGSDIFGGVSGGPHSAEVTLIFKEFLARERPSTETIREVRGKLQGIGGAEITFEKEQHGPPTGAAVTIRIVGEDLKTLERLSKAIQGRIADVPGLVNLQSDLEATRPELVVNPSRREAKLAGVSTAAVGQFLKMAIFGREVGKYREYNDEYDITLRLPVEQRRDINDLTQLHIPNAQGQAVPVHALSTLEYRGGYGTINHVSRERVVTLTGDAAEGELGPEVLKRVMARLTPEQFPLPEGYTIRYAGENEEMEKAMAFLLKAGVIAVLLIVFILVAQFNSLSVPLIIMVTVLLSLIGVFLGLVTCRLPFGVIMTGIGVISLAGVVVNNAIVLLDYTRQLQRRGMDLVAATVEAGATRLRPVFLTATTTTLGLVPMATGISFDFHTFSWAMESESSLWWRSMAIALIFGLSFATLLTLVVVPTLYVVLYRFARWMGLKGIEPPKDVASPGQPV